MEITQCQLRLKIGICRRAPTCNLAFRTLLAGNRQKKCISKTTASTSKYASIFENNWSVHYMWHRIFSGICSTSVALLPVSVSGICSFAVPPCSMLAMSGWSSSTGNSFRGCIMCRCPNHWRKWRTCCGSPPLTTS